MDDLLVIFQLMNMKGHTNMEMTMSQKKNVYNRTLWTWTFCPINIHIRIKEFHDIFKYYKFENNFANIVINELNFLFILYHINIDTI